MCHRFIIIRVRSGMLLKSAIEVVHIITICIIKGLAICNNKPHTVLSWLMIHK